MRKCYLFLMMLFVQLITCGGIFAADPPTEEYDAAIEKITNGAYYIKTTVDGVDYYVTEAGDITDNKSADGVLFTVTQVDASTDADKLFDVAFLLETPTMGGHFSNTTLVDDKAVLHPDDHLFRIDGSNNRNSWERQLFYFNGEKFAIRSCNTAYAETSWKDAGRAFWTYEVDEANEPIYSEYDMLLPCYTYEPAYIWELEAAEGDVLLYTEINTIITRYEEQLWDERDTGESMNMGDGFGQHTDWDSWYALYDLLQEIYACAEQFDFDMNWTGDEDEKPTVEQVEEWKTSLSEWYDAILASVVSFKVEDGYYRIFAYKRYKSTFDESGFVDKAIAASYSADHKDRAVYSTVRRDLANFVWKLELHGDSIAIKNVGMGTYISFSSLAENKVVMTEDPNDASHVAFDYAGHEYAEYADADGELQGELKDVFAIRLAGTTSDPNSSYFHQNNHTCSGDANTPYTGGEYETDLGSEQELTFWVRTYDTRTGNDKWTSEWYLEPVPEEEIEGLMEAFEPIVNHDILLQRNQELRNQVAETLALAKDVIRTKMITSADQLDNRFGDPSEGTNIANLIDNNPETFWHTTWHGLAEGVEMMVYEDEEGNTYDCHYLQISGMQNMVGNCELFLQERAGADNDRVKTLVLMGTDNLKNEDDEWEEIVKITLPHTGKGEANTVPFHMDEAYPYIRLLVIEVASSNYEFRQFWHAAEIQFYTVEENPNSQFVLMGEVAEALQEAYDANVATADADITLDVYNALLNAYNAFLAYGLVDPAELRAALATYAKATEGAIEGTNPGQWANTDIVDAYNALYAEVEAYNKAGKYDYAQIHKYAVMLKAMQKSVMEKANVVETDKWYRFMYPTEEMFDAYGFGKDGADNCNELTREDQHTMYGTFVSPATLISEEGIGYDDDGNEITTTDKWVESVFGDDLRESDRLFFVNDEELNEKDPSMFRFVEIESDANDYTPLFQEAKDNMAMALDMSTTYTRVDTLITSAAQLSSNASDPSEGLHIEYLTDGKSNTFWHSDWHQQFKVQPYLQVALNEPVSGLIQVDITRREGIDFGHIVRMYVQGSNDGETWRNIGYLETPYAAGVATVTSQPIDLGAGCSYLRFTITRRAGKDIEFDPFQEITEASPYDEAGGWTYFHAAEFQIYTVTPNVELSENALHLQWAYITANKVLLNNVTAEDLAATANAYRAYRADFNAAEGKDILPYGMDKAKPVYAIQNKATGLFVFVDGTGNQNNIYLKTIPTLFNYTAIGYERSLLGGKNLAGQSTNYLHAGESNRRFCTWSTTEPTTNSGLVICEADEEYAAPAEFSFIKEVKPGRIIDWCHSISLTPVDAPDDAFAYSAVGQYTIEDEGTYLAVKAIETIPAGEPALYIYGDTTVYDAEDDYAEPIKFTVPGNEVPVVKGTMVNGLVGTLVSVTLDKCEIYFDANHVGTPEREGSIAVTPCSAYLDLDNCPQVDPDGDFDFSIFLGDAAESVAVGVKDISSAIEKISQPGNVYSVDGKLLRSGATLNSLKTMGKGMYILNGVKVVVK